MTRLRIPVQLRWSDMDAYGHINNVQMFRILEEARIAAFWSHPNPADGGWPTAVIDAGVGAATTTLVASQEIEYLRPLEYRREPVTVELWIGHLGGASIDVCYQVVDGGGDGTVDGVAAGTGAPVAEAPYARACTTLVLADEATGSPRRLTPAERASWTPFLGPMVQLRRRRPAAPSPQAVGR
ncbi:acyl-CoA thioesterase [Pengzhenrongella sicca]|uniref:Acyl-CoA thioesterase n=1 Tax=Pengzhenrongella sicca TaxID=2819238 RepID=A0A8A4ZEN2_9MICO|nr:acyl-CoA thioesterase [Pengzhenrongella sicca]QTE30440.1 acyl-CoA thioesterase [Pengzhenrongella sicca]